MREEKTEMMGIILKTNKQKIKNKNTLKKNLTNTTHESKVISCKSKIIHDMLSL